MVRRELADFGLPIRFNRSARCRTCNSRFSMSTSPHLSPRSSEERIPVKMAVTRNGRARPFAAAMIRAISSRDGMSTPIWSFAAARLSALIDTPSAGSLARVPRRRASLRMALRVISTFCAVMRANRAPVRRGRDASAARLRWQVSHCPFVE